ncbi:MAG TPA: COX15/CtaA family protein [Egibacteraceae bacterium]|nr:COX15/CtaA family protein [Egibacteraceae bacterium]
MPEHRHPGAAPARARLSGFQRLAVTATLVTLLLIAMGGLVRATDSGLACPDWPQCYGKLIPRQADLPEGLSLVNVWIEHSHRLVASVVGFLILAVVVWAVRSHRDRPMILWPALAALGLVVAQAYLGRQVVLGLLRANLVTAHLGMALAVVACLAVVTVETFVPRASGAAGRGRRMGLARLGAGIALLAYVQALVGATVTGLGAGLAFRGFPLADGQLLPPVATRPEAMHMTHRLLALILAAAIVYLAWRAARYRSQLVSEGAWDPRQHWVVRLAMWAAALVAVQIGLGAANLWNDLSAVTVVPHLAIASWIWTVLVVLTALAYRLAPAQPRQLRVPVTGAERRQAGEASREAASQ